MTWGQDATFGGRASPSRQFLAILPASEASAIRAEKRLSGEGAFPSPAPPPLPLRPGFFAAI
jgi:hypothetical protein